MCHVLGTKGSYFCNWFEKSCKKCYFGGFLYNKKQINFQCCKDYVSYISVVVTECC